MSEIKKCGYIKIPKLFIPRKLNLLVRLTDRNLKSQTENTNHLEIYPLLKKRGHWANRDFSEYRDAA